MTYEIIKVAHLF